MEKRTGVGRGFETLAMHVMLLAIEDYNNAARREDCNSFLDEDVFILFCSMLDTDDEKMRAWMKKMYKKRKKMKVRSGVYNYEV